MTERERFIESVTFGRPDRLIFEHSYGLMPGTIERWHAEGLPAEVDEAGIYEHFGFTPPQPGLPVDFGLCPAFETTEQEREDGVTIRRDGMGVLKRLRKDMTTLAIPFEFPIKTAADWPDYDRRLQFSPERIGGDLDRRYGELRSEGRPVSAAWTGFYWFPRDLMGDAGVCTSYYTQPELVHEILRTYADMIFAVSEELLIRVEVDHMHIGEDMCYRNGMMIGPATFREFMAPHYRRLIALYRAHGTRVFSVDSDGDLTELIPLLMEVGVNCVMPCEVRAGNDVVAMRRRHSARMAYSRGINKLALCDRPVCLVPGARPDTLAPREAIDRELEYRLPFMVRSGGYIAGLDHRVVPQTSLENFTYYVRRVREMLALSLDVPALAG